MPLWGFLLSFVAAALWAASPIMVDKGLAVAKCSSSAINPVRAVAFLAASLVFALCSSGGSIPLLLSPAAWLYIFIGVFISYSLGDIFYFIAIRTVGVTIAVPIANAYPILVALSSWLILGEPLTLKLLWGILIVITGLLMLRFGGRKKESAEDVAAVLRNKKRFLKGFAFSMAAGLMWALSSPLTKKAILITGYDAANITFYRAVAFFIVAFTIHWLTLKYRPEKAVKLRSLSAAAVGWFAGSAVLGLCIGSILYATCITVMPVAVVTAITATSPLIAALFGHFVLKEELYRLQWAGIALIITGSVVVGL